ncbi:MAG: hypothetical protein ACWA44_00785 [Thiotrichales bacterium]
MLLIVDANVLIDYANTDASILALCANHLGELYVPRVVLEEVEQLSEAECIDLGLQIVDEPVEILLAAGESRGRLSYEDHVCLLLAKQESWTCLSNDRALHSACCAAGIESIWGLRPMIELVRSGQLDYVTAIETAQAIHESNPRHITEEIIVEFETKIRDI